MPAKKMSTAPKPVSSATQKDATKSPKAEPKAKPEGASTVTAKSKATPKKPAKPKPAESSASAVPAKTGAGRPSLYRPEYCEQLLEFFDIEPTREVTRQHVAKDGSVVEITQTVPNDLPTLAGFCCKIGVHRETLLNWSKAHPEMFDALKHAKEHQERILVANGITGFYDKTFAIFTAKNLINWRDKQEVEHDVKPEGILAGLIGSMSGGLKVRE